MKLLIKLTAHKVSIIKVKIQHSLENIIIKLESDFDYNLELWNTGSVADAE